MLVKLDMVLFVNINCKYVVITDPINQFQTESISFQPSSDWSKSVGHLSDGTAGPLRVSKKSGPSKGGMNFSDSCRGSLSEPGQSPSLLSALPWEDEVTDSLDTAGNRFPKREFTLSNSSDLVCRSPKEADDWKRLCELAIQGEAWWVELGGTKRVVAK